MKSLVPNSLGEFKGALLQITGEVVAPKTIKNARNYAAGALNLKDTQEFNSRELRFIAYGVQKSWNECWSKDMEYLLGFGFDTVLSNDWTAYPDDGLVFRIDDYKDFDALGYTSKHPRGAYALKQRNEGVITKLVDVVWNVGKSGVVAPVAILEAIEIDGAVVSRATLHNMRYINDLNLEIGCLVEVIRSGEIIPRILSRAN
jgi:DNA ligase (NAD+)